MYPRSRRPQDPKATDGSTAISLRGITDGKPATPRYGSLPVASLWYPLPDRQQTQPGAAYEAQLSSDNIDRTVHPDRHRRYHENIEGQVVSQSHCRPSDAIILQQAYTHPAAVNGPTCVQSMPKRFSQGTIDSELD